MAHKKSPKTDVGSKNKALPLKKKKQEQSLISKSITLPGKNGLYYWEHA